MTTDQGQSLPNGSPMQPRQAWRPCAPHRTVIARAILWLGLLLWLCSAGCSTSRPQPQPRSLETLVQESLEVSRQHAQQQSTADAARQQTLAQQRVRVIDDSMPRAIDDRAVQLASHVAPLDDSAHTDRGYQLVQGIDLGIVDAPRAGGPLVSDIFEETDVRQALISLATQAKTTVIVDDQVSGVTSAMIDREPFEAALRKVLLPLGLVYRKRDGEYLVGVPDPASSLFPLIAGRFEFRPLHLSPSELTGVLPERFKPFLRVVDKRNLILIEAPEEIGRRIVAELQHADRPVPQVVLESIVCVFTPESRFRFGFDLEQGVQVGSGLHQLKLAGLHFSGALSPHSIANLFGEFAVTSHFLQALAEDGYVKIRAAPRVMAKDGEKARIAINRETFFSVQPPEVQVFFRQDIERVEAGIMLDIVPVVRGDNVTVTIENAEVSEDIRKDGLGPELSGPFPLINRRRVSTTVHVKDGHTIVIGGLVQRQMINRLSKVPVLGDLPGVGKLFQRIDQQEQEAEVAIFLSPRIVHPPEAAPAAAPPLHIQGIEEVEAIE